MKEISSSQHVSVLSGLTNINYYLVHVNTKAELKQPAVKVKKNLLFIFDVSLSMKEHYENLYAMFSVLLDDSVSLNQDRIDFIFFGVNAEFYSAKAILDKVKQNPKKVVDPLKDWFDTLCRELRSGTIYSKAFGCLFDNLKIIQEPYTIFFATDGMPYENKKPNDVCRELSEKLEKFSEKLDIIFKREFGVFTKRIR
jgi:hypothetical protein